MALIKEFRTTSEVSTVLQILRDATMTGKTWKELFKYLYRERQWVPDLDDDSLYSVSDVRIVPDMSASSAQQGKVAYL